MIWIQLFLFTSLVFYPICASTPSKVFSSPASLSIGSSVQIYVVLRGGGNQYTRPHSLGSILPKQFKNAARTESNTRAVVAIFVARGRQTLGLLLAVLNDTNSLIISCISLFTIKIIANVMFQFLWICIKIIKVINYLTTVQYIYCTLKKEIFNEEPQAYLLAGGIELYFEAYIANIHLQIEKTFL